LTRRINPPDTVVQSAIARVEWLNPEMRSKSPTVLQD
jgi:hypothetical protein